MVGQVREKTPASGQTGVALSASDMKTGSYGPNWRATILSGIIGGILIAVLVALGGRLWDWIWTPSLPSDSVVAFDRAKCPDGWVDFAQAKGRIVIGADDAEFKWAGAPLGSWTTKIEERHLPSHSHALSADSFRIWRGATKFDANIYGVHNDAVHAPDELQKQMEANAKTGATGQGEPLKVVPPYYALTLCKKK